MRLLHERLRFALVAAILPGCTSSPSAATDAATSSGPGSTTGSEASGGTPTGSSTGTAPDVCAELAELPEAEFPATFAATLCAQKRDCGCDTTFACEGVVQEAFAKVQTYGQAQGLVYDGGCAARLLMGLIAQFGCERASEARVTAQARACDIDCYLYRGAVDVGAACVTPPVEIGLFVSDCADPALCSAGQCSLWFEKPLDAGEVCVSLEAGTLGKCTAGTRCELAGDAFVCVQIVTEGEACDATHVCERSHWCGPSDVCTPQKAAGEPCVKFSECASSRCVDQVCDDPVWVCGIDGPEDL